jgi:hypothetical protein
VGEEGRASRVAPLEGVLDVGGEVHLWQWGAPLEVEEGVHEVGVEGHVWQWGALLEVA